MSLPVFEFSVPGELAQLFAHRLKAGLWVYGEPKSGRPEEATHSRLSDTLKPLLNQTGPFERVVFRLTDDLVPALCDGLAYWLAQTQNDAGAEINKLACALLEQARAEARKTIVDYLATL